MADGRRLKLGGLASIFDAVPAFSTFTMNQTTDALEFIFKVDNDGGGNKTITHVGFRYGTRTGTPPTWIISLQGVTNGVPDGTIKGGGSPASATFTPPADTTWNNTWQWIALANSYVAAPGEDLALVIAYSSGTVDASNSSSFTTVMSNSSSNTPFCITNDAGVRTVSTSASYPVFGYKTASKAYGRPCQTIATVTYQSGSSPNEYAMKMAPLAAWSATFTIGTVNVLSASAAAGTFLIQLYSGGGASDVTVLQDIQHDTDNQASTSSRRTHIPFNETSLSTLNFGDTNRISILAQTATNVVIYTLAVATASDWDAWPGGQDFSLSTLSGGTWTDTATTRILADVVLADVTEAAGSAGIITPAGWGGGFN